ncbi:amidohydrolase family protein [Saccharopolyspora erythraea]|uniref:N-acyl-D-amino-acid deacylase family protein n=1 Tax=Saccharopolyspora erythraea TaxID=1836 RepID=UPI001BAA3719|nr:amidohydrolase family protein [Saccharopolyspora erythraea]QUH02958.1 amidohydrolase family protein [Saccharopolyspora erythraea]
MNPTLTDTVLLTGALLADGTGRPLRPADVLVLEGRVAAVEPPGVLPRTHPVRDLTGLVLAPGFVDVHSHADNAALLDHDDTTKILQGVTTEIVGNCGFSLAPNNPDRTTTLATFLQRIFPPVDLAWTGFHELYAATDTAGYVTNQCPLIGHGTLRIAATGMSDAAPDDHALRTMRDALEEGMTAGAFGLSSGLIYPPAVFATTGELLTLAEALGGDGLYATHMRDEGSGLLDSVDEALRIGRAAGRTHISHLKAAGPENWGTVPAALTKLQDARRDGHPVMQDVYPYTASSTMLTATLPKHFLACEADELVARLDSSSGRAELIEANRDRDWDTILIATTASHRHEGRTIAELAAEQDARPADVLADILVGERLRASMVHFSMHEDDLVAALADPHTTIGSDGLPPGIGGKPHPRLHGTFPRVLGRYCRERGVFSLPEAVRRMTSMPAEAFRIPERGLVAPGHIADLVAFDATTVTDVGDYRDPVHPPAGIPWVALAGYTVVDHGMHVAPRRGRRLTPAW